MKTMILVGDGMGDYPHEQLGGKTALQAAAIPNIRRIAAAGRTRCVQTVPDEVQPGSDVANMSLLGYDPRQNYTGRAPIEAAGAGLALAADDVAYRCNLVTVADGLMSDYSAGHISTAEAEPLIEVLNANLAREGMRFHRGVSYRHLLIWRGGPVDVVTQPPHDIADQTAEPYLPRGDREDDLRSLIAESRRLFADHPVNAARRAAGKNPASQIWLWGQGKALSLDGFAKRYGLSGGVVSAVDLIRGLGRIVGLEAPVIPGATGFLDTDCAAKVAAALRLVEDGSFAYVHFEAPDECGHQGRLDLKVQAIEMFDREIVAPIWSALEARGEPYRLVLCTDHRTPVAVRGHTREPVPMTVLEGPVGPVSDEAPFDEFVHGGDAEIMAFEWIRETLSAS